MSAATPILGVVSGKGGVGKTSLVANLAVAARSLGARVLAVDGDLGLASLDVLLGLAPKRDVSDLLSGGCALEEVLIEGPLGIHVLPACSARPDLVGLRPRALAPLLGSLFGASDRYDLVLVDMGSGIGSSVVSLALSCDQLLLVTTPDPTSLADAYATLKVLRRSSTTPPVELVVNGARGSLESCRTASHLQRVAARFLGASPPVFGHVHADPRLAEAVRMQQSVLQAFPGARSARQLGDLAERALGVPCRPEWTGPSGAGSRP